ncbi:AbrB/MazE/SpoVT family DNA-binding domain-containing protein [Candidatus Pacearchaeota archaeon]|nr:AbrB/MazE/SpoVT family DNA-binding domain-containing protein [Candidatus Pacearchaeota archaeon]
MEIETTTRRWGNSIVVVIPANIVEKQKIKENERVKFKVEKSRRLKVKDVFGLLKDWKKPTEEIIQEARKGWD